MAIARAKLVELTVTRWYHCVSRCVRKAFLLGEGEQNRKGWLEDRLEELADIFAVAVGGFSVMDKLRGERLRGRFFAASRDKLREIAQHLGVRHLVNLNGFRYSYRVFCPDPERGEPPCA